VEIARQIKKKQGVQIITNGVNIAAELLDAPNIQVFIVGGTVRGDSASSLDALPRRCSLSSPPTRFMSGAGCDLDFGVSGPNLEETMVNRAMLRISREIILVGDASKFSKRSMSRITHFSEIDTVISDTSLSEDIQDKLRAQGCNSFLSKRLHASKKQKPRSHKEAGFAELRAAATPPDASGCPQRCSRAASAGSSTRLNSLPATSSFPSALPPASHSGATSQRS